MPDFEHFRIVERFSVAIANRSMSSDQKIAELKRQLGETVQRIDTIQQGRQLSLAGKISHHFKTQGGSLINVVLTASVLAVALGKMQQKAQFQVKGGAIPAPVANKVY